MKEGIFKTLDEIISENLKGKIGLTSILIGRYCTINGQLSRGRFNTNRRESLCTEI